MCEKKCLLLHILSYQMVFGAARYVSYVVLVSFLVFGCTQKNQKEKNIQNNSSIDSAVSKLEAQADTGFRSSFDLLVHIADSLEEICLRSDDQQCLARLYSTRGTIARWRERYLEALDWCEKSLTIHRGSNTKNEINVLTEMGDIYFRIGKKRLANDYYLQALDISERIADDVARVIVLDKLAGVYYHQTHYAQALKTYLETLDLVRVYGYNQEHNTKEMQLLNNIALCYVKLQQYDSANFYYDSALQEADKLNISIQDVAHGVIFGNMGHLYQLKGDYKKAVEYLNRNISVNSLPNGDNADVVTSYTYLLEIYNELDSTKNFQRLFDTALYFCHEVKRNSIHHWRARLYGIMSERLSKQNDLRKAFMYRTMQMNLKDSMESVDKVEDIQDQVYFHQLQNQTIKVKALEKDNKVQQVRIQAYLALSILSVILFIVAMLGLYSYRRNLKKEKDLNKQIASQNQQITLNKLELEQAIEEMKLLNIEKNRLLGMVAHDLRGPIYNITGVVQLLESSPSFSRFSDNDAQLVDLIKKSCENALDVINDLLEAAKLDNVGLDGEKRPENIAEIIRNSIRLYENRAQQKDIEIHFTEPAHEVIATVGKEKINRALGNLISNAIKFSHKNSRIDVVLTQTADKVLISVEDRGMGIPLADREAIFDKFTRAKRQGTDGEKPVGLGMSIVKQIVDVHNGRIWLDSEVGAGTTFYIELPIV